MRVLVASAYVVFKKAKRYLPPVVRSVLGIVFILFGILGFLPIIGFWMAPLGLALLASDIPPLERWLAGKLRRARAGRKKP